MSWLDKLEKLWRPYTIPNLTLHLILGQFVCFALGQAKPELLGLISLVPARVLDGEVWRLLTFIFDPPLAGNPIFLFFAWYIFYLMGDALEGQWGAARYNVFLVIGYLATVAVAFLTPNAEASNAFLAGSVFLAFAYLFPDFQLYLFFILPVKVKWLALITWIGYFLTFTFGSWSSRLLIVASISNFLLFFGRDILLAMRSRRRRMATQVEKIKREIEPMNRCIVCGATERSHPQLEFRYCSRCYDTPCYCSEHLRSHPHRAAPADETPAEEAAASPEPQ